MKLLFKADQVYVDGQFRQNWAICTENGRIIEAGEQSLMEGKYHQAMPIDWTGKAILPGTVNAHNHSFQSLLRGIAVDRPFLEWRDQALYKYTPLLDEEAIYIGALFAFGEMLKYGVTTVSDFFYVHDGGTAMDEAVIKAAKDLGIRLVLARTMYDWDGAPASYRETVQDAVKRTRELAVKYQGNRMVTVHPAPHSPHAASPEMIQAGYKLAIELDTPFHIHVAEEPFEVEETLAKYGLRPVHYLNKLGVLDERMIAVHLVWLEDSEIRLLGEKRAGLAYCPSSNMFLSDGVTNIPGLLAAGVRVSLGTDGACSNNRISVFEEMRMCSLLQKISRLDGTCINAGQVLHMGTQAGGELLRLPIGDIRPGNYADFVSVDLKDLSLSPVTELFANIVYSMQPTAVKDVVVDGKIVVGDGRLLTMKESAIVQKINDLLNRWE
ncbi:5-methylthioadenosine/S-adenosylhomocysteine deaminase [Paenibacillus sophorae]|uniref:5-methylthioadenosine/S-adenosylhomocysteine deaminase n=1 Tax=Paenibacillus sophorae TaxID=1333845 RepID=A0A1H8FJ53_9BACL|nr:amidohydrolase [Paenibacillus sophorae]QWU13873.1 amidohydrolase [Paenibacillus sophorae]SEN31177.1 5-methylthioadenosine/S-adenosylhomocysteine deaminase [Paenibacillus sophorae]